MLNWLNSDRTLRATARELYGRVVTAARQPAFYKDLHVSDTPEGRYEMVVLHLFLALERLGPDGAAGQKLAQAVIETFVTDMDDCMREMGVGDMVVPKRVKRAAAGFYERAGAYRAALKEEDGSLAGLLDSSFFAGTRPAEAARLASYVRACARRMSATASASALAGTIDFPFFEAANP